MTAESSRRSPVVQGFAGYRNARSLPPRAACASGTRGQAAGLRKCLFSQRFAMLRKSATRRASESSMARHRSNPVGRKAFQNPRFSVGGVSKAHRIDVLYVAMACSSCGCVAAWIQFSDPRLLLREANGLSQAVRWMLRACAFEMNADPVTAFYSSSRTAGARAAA